MVPDGCRTIANGYGAIWHVISDDGIDADPAVVTDGDFGMNACAHPDHAPLTDLHIACHGRMGQDDAEIADRDPRTQNIVRKEMNVPAEINIGDDREGTDVAPLADPGVRRNHRGWMDDSRPPTATQGRAFADGLSMIRVRNRQESVDLRAIHFIDETDLMPENQSGRSVIHNSADGNSRGFQNTN